MSLTYHGPINTNPAPGESRITIYGYIPALGLALTALISFAVVAALHFWWSAKKGRAYRTFHILMGVGCLVEVGGYAARTLGHYKPFRVDNFVAQFFLIVVAPVLFCAAIDLTLLILVRGVPGTERLLLLKPRTVLIIFVTIDAFCTIVQIAGAGLVGATQSARADGRSLKLTAEQASNILLAGLAMQVASWAVFLLFLSVALVRAHRRRRPSGSSGPGGAGAGAGQPAPAPVRWFLYEILLVTLLIILRACFRLSETALGFFTGIANSEVAFALLEYVPVIVAVGLLALLPPSWFVEHPRTRVEAEAEAEAEKVAQMPTTTATSASDDSVTSAHMAQAQRV